MNISRVRTSSGTFLRRGHDEIVEEIENRISDFTFIPVGTYVGFFFFSLTALYCYSLFSWKFLVELMCDVIIAENGESLQVLHYEVGQKYEPHHDYFVDEFNVKRGGQRIATVLMYL